MSGSPAGPFEGTLEQSITNAADVVFLLGAWSLRMMEISNEGDGNLRYRFAADSESAPGIVIALGLDSFAPNISGGQVLAPGTSVYRVVPNGFNKLVIRANALEPASTVIVSPADLQGE